MGDTTTATPGPRRKRRAGRFFVWFTCLVVVVPLLAAGSVLALLETGFGQRLAAAEVTALSGGAVQIAGLGGTPPWNLRIARISVRDRNGVYAILEGVELRWSPLALLSSSMHIRSLTANVIELTRLPQAQGGANKAAPASLGAPSGLPVAHLAIDQLAVRRLTLGAPIAGTPATLAVSGRADLASPGRGTAKLVVHRLDAPGSYVASARLMAQTIALRIDAKEPDRGLLAGIARLPHLGGKLHLRLSLAGPRDAAALHLALAAGPLTASAAGTIDLPARAATLDVQASAPAMAPAAGLAWRSVAIETHLSGTLSRPHATGRIRIAGLSAAGATIGSLDATLQGRQGTVTLAATADGVLIPGPQPTLFSAAPFQLTATARLGTAPPQVRFRLRHPLATARGTVALGASPHGTLRLVLPDLTPFAAMAGVPLTGSTTLAATFAQHGANTAISLSGPLAITGGLRPVVALIGGTGHLALHAALHAAPSGLHLAVRSATLTGAALRLAAHGSAAGSALEAACTIDLPDLAAASPALRGQLRLRGTASGTMDNLAAHLLATGSLGTRQIPPGPLAFSADLTGLPRRPRAEIVLHATLDGAPLALAADARRNRQTSQIHLRTLDWKTLHGTADLSLPPGAAFPLGTLDISMQRLADLTPLLGLPLSGSASAQVATAVAGATPRVTLTVQAKDAGTAAARISAATLNATITNPAGRAAIAMRLVAHGIRAGQLAADATATASGTLSDLAIGADASLTGLESAPLRLSARAKADLPARQVVLGTLTAAWKGEDLHLLAPARIAYGPRLTIGQLRLALGTATLEIAGQVLPTLDLTAALAHATPALARPFFPALQASGMADIGAHLTGSLAAPGGTVRIAARDMRLLAGHARALPPAALTATLGLARGRTTVDARLRAGKGLALTLTGTAPLGAAGPLALAARGDIDLALANPILEANGQHVAGRLAIDTALRGSVQQPALSGTLDLSGGELQDVARGVHLTDISGRIIGQGRSLRIENGLAHAGPGTIGLTGSIGALQPGIPLDLALRMNNAQPLASDLLTADLDANLTLRGRAQRRLDLSGTISVRHATINIPDRFPPSVATLDVVRPGQRAPAPPSPAPLLGLDLNVHAPPAIFVRGRGLFARLGGDLRLRGTSAAPQVSDGFQLANGSFALAGANLTLTEGNVTFTGQSITGRLNPVLHFVAQSQASGITARLTVAGTASHPTIALSSTPTLPQDEVLAHLLYGVSLSQLSPLQLAAIAQALYSLTHGGGGGPLSGIQSALGLDRLAVGSSSGHIGAATLQAGKYVAPGVYVGASRSMSGSTHAQVQINLTKRLKLNTQASTGGSVSGAAPQDSTGGSIGLSYQLDY
ncbi:MAG: translocation/assembly module TamB domain-containing protein [Rhodospirillales bacterium]|nr:translocation/assembly module TamB domain-containing protein [Rhodospirillales bacterium]